MGPNFIKAGPGFGDSCFQKDILNLVYLCGYYDLHEVAAYWQQVVSLNTWQQHRIARLVVTKLFGTVTGKRLAVLGLAYGIRPTASTRPIPTTPRVAAGFSAGVSPAIRICRDLLEEGAELVIVDPKVSAAQITRDVGQAPSGAASSGQVRSAQGSDGAGGWQLGCGCGLWGRRLAAPAGREGWPVSVGGL